MELKLSDKDVKYFEVLNDNLLELERRVAALELEKSRVIDIHKDITKKYQEFSQQIRTKYDVTHPDATIDLEAQTISWPDDNADAGSSGTETGAPLKNSKDEEKP